MPVREGLARLEGVESISERCNRQAGTGELRLKNGRLVDPQSLAKQIADVGVGARLRGLGGGIGGVLGNEGGKAVLRVAKSNEILEPAPLTTKVQIDAVKSKKPEPPAKQEKEAYKKLRARAKDEPQAVRITGPLRAGNKIEVRIFELKSS